MKIPYVNVEIEMRVFHSGSLRMKLICWRKNFWQPEVLQALIYFRRKENNWYQVPIEIAFCTFYRHLDLATTFF